MNKPYAAAVQAATARLAETGDEDKKKTAPAEDEERKDEEPAEEDPAPPPAEEDPAPGGPEPEEGKPAGEDPGEDPGGGEDDEDEEDDKVAALERKLQALEARVGRMQATLRNPAVAAASMAPADVPAASAPDSARFATREAAEAAYSKLADPRKQAAFRSKYRALMDL